MSLPPVVLDDLTWADLTDASRGRIPSASHGLWTLHAPVDPGVTLLELYAWLLEQRLYWMDQLPDALIRGGLALLGDAQRDAATAATVLHFPSGPGPVAAGATMVLQDSDPPMIFTTHAATAVIPLVPASTVRPRVDLRVGNHEHGPDLLAGKPVCLFTDASDLMVTLTLWLSGPMPAGADATLLVQLDQTEVPVAWDVSAVDGVAPPSRLSWWYAAAGGAQAALPDVVDGTLGLRRSGIVRFTVPADWTAGAADAAGNLPFTLWLRTETNGFTSAPRLAGLWPNVAVARHFRDIVPFRMELEWLKLPGNVIALGGDQMLPLGDGTSVRLRERTGWEWWRPVADLTFSGPEDRVFTIERDRGLLRFGNGETGRIPVLSDLFTADELADPAGLLADWQGQTELAVALRALMPATARVLILGATAASAETGPILQALIEVLNALLAAPLQDQPALRPVRTVTGFLLADTPRGAIRPRLNRLLLEDAYQTALRRGQAELHLRIGGGRSGNVGLWRQWEPAGCTKAPNAVNVAPGQGGADPEPLVAAQQRSAGEIRQVTRAVLPADFETLATATKGVAIARAHAAVSFHPDFPCLPVPGVVTVFVVPAAPRDEECGTVGAPVPDAGALTAVAAALEGARLLGTEIVVRPPIYETVRLVVDVQADSAAPDRLRDLVTAQLTRFLDPLIGGEGGDGWPFGEKMRPSELLRQAQDAVAAAGEVTGLAITLPDAKPPIVAQSCSDVDIGAHALPAVTHVAVRITAPAQARGGLT